MSKIGTKVQLYLAANGKDYKTEFDAGNVIVRIMVMVHLFTLGMLTVLQNQQTHN